MAANIRPTVAILGFYTQQEGPTLPGSRESFMAHAGLLSEVALFFFQISRQNPTQIVKFGDFTDEEVAELVSIARRNRIRVMPVIHNLLYGVQSQEVGRNVVRELVSTPLNRQAFARNVLNLLARYHFDGVNMDIEYVYVEDRDLLSQFYRELGAVLRQNGYVLAASVPSKTGEEPGNIFAAPFDYQAIGRAVDEFVVMLYNEHGFPGSGPGPVVSSGRMERVLGYAMSLMPREKITAALSVFGFDFNLTTGQNTYMTYASAIATARRYGSNIIFDQQTQTPMFAYRDEAGNFHEVWFENAASIMAKTGIAARFGINGVALWRLGMEDPMVWERIRSELIVKK